MMAMDDGGQWQTLVDNRPYWCWSHHFHQQLLLVLLLLMWHVVALVVPHKNGLDPLILHRVGLNLSQSITVRFGCGLDPQLCMVLRTSLLNHSCTGEETCQGMTFFRTVVLAVNGSKWSIKLYSDS